MYPTHWEVMDGNWTIVLLHILSAASLPLRVGSYPLHGYMMCLQNMSHALNGGSVVMHFKHGDVLEIHGLWFDFCPGQPHTYIVCRCWL